MKKTVILIATIIAFSSCGTLYGGRITQCQTQRPEKGQREIRPAALIGDIIFIPLISLTVDFVDGGIYRPCPTNNTPAPNK